MQAPLERGSHIQARITLESESYFDFLRLDSLWVETSPPLALQVVGEVARFDEPDPERGFTEVSLGEMTDFTYDIQAQFDNVSQRGFDALRIRTGSRPHFKGLEMGDPLVARRPWHLGPSRLALRRRHDRAEWRRDVSLLLDRHRVRRTLHILLGKQCT